jgi:hypothetical protein
VPAFVRRFRVSAAVVAATVLVLTGGILTALALVVQRTGVGGALTLVGVTLVLAAMLVFGAARGVRRAQGLRAVAARHPGAVVFLGRRQPAVVNNVDGYLGSRGIEADVENRWLVAVFDARGFSVWGLGRTPAEMLVIPWSELGAIEVADLEPGNTGRGIAIDVRPFETPLVLSVGYSAFGTTGLLGRDGVGEVCAGANALRPTAG